MYSFDIINHLKINIITNKYFNLLLNPKSSVSTNFTTPAYLLKNRGAKILNLF